MHAFLGKIYKGPKCSRLDVLEALYTREMKAMELQVQTRQNWKATIVLFFVVLGLTHATQVLYSQHENFGVSLSTMEPFLAVGKLSSVVWVLHTNNHTKLPSNDGFWVLVVRIWGLNFLDHEPQRVTELLEDVFYLGELKTKKEGRTPL